MSSTTVAIETPASHLIIGDNIYLPLKKHPNFFHRFMMRLIFGWEFEKG